MGGIPEGLSADLVVVGAGPAGVSAALWARSRGLDPLLIEGAARPGGQLHAIYFHPRETAGVPTGTGAEIAGVYAAQLEEAGIRALWEAAATALDMAPDGPPAVRIEDGTRLAGRAVLVATGARRRLIDVAGEAELENRGVSYSATRDREGFAGRDVAVVGGGDAAYENALLLAEVGCRVMLLVRDGGRARATFRDRVAGTPAIQVVQGASVTAFLGRERLEAVRYEREGATHELPIAGAVIKIGMVPNTEWCREALATDDEGYVRVDPRGRTSRAGVWAAGDVTHPLLPAITVAIGTAAVAVADVAETLEAGA